MSNGDIVPMRVFDLAFDLENPRLAEFDLKKDSTDSEVIQVLWEAMDVRELVLSIAASGFFRHEPLIVMQQGSKNIVIEGNRRLAAVRVLLDPTLVEAPKEHIPPIEKEAKEDLTWLPTISGTRRDTWRYIGFKHVNGPAKWSSYAKSQYIAKVHREFDVPLEDIAMQIGDTHKTVQRLFRGMMVIEQAERMNVFSRQDRWRTALRVLASLSPAWTTPVSTPSSDCVRRSDEEPEPVPLEKKEELRELCLWLYGSRKGIRLPSFSHRTPILGDLMQSLRTGRQLRPFALELTLPWLLRSAGRRPMFSRSPFTLRKETWRKPAACYLPATTALINY